MSNDFSLLLECIWSFSNNACSFTFFRLPTRLESCLLFGFPTSNLVTPDFIHQTLFICFHFLYIPIYPMLLLIHQAMKFDWKTPFTHFPGLYLFFSVSDFVFIKFCFGSQTYLHGPTCSCALILFAIIYWNSLTFYLLFHWRITVKTTGSKMYSAKS